MSSRDRLAPYDGHAGGYASRIGPTLSGVAQRVAELAGAAPGVQLLDLATGTGMIAGFAATRGASAVGVDISAGMLDEAKRRFPGLQLVRADACALPFDDRSFDAVTCGLALSHFGDRARVLSEVLRVLRPGGRLVASAWTGGGVNPAGAVGNVLDRFASSGPGVDEATWATAETGRDIIRAAGFDRVTVERCSFDGEFADVDDAVAWAAAWPGTAARVASLDSARRLRFLSDARQAVAVTGLAWRLVFNVYVAVKAAGV